MGDPQNGWFIMEIPFEMDDLKFRVPHFQETSIYYITKITHHYNIDTAI